MSAAPMNEELFIGLMSGTSIDGIDGVLVRFDEGKIHLVQTTSVEMDEVTRQQLIDLNHPGSNELQQAAILDRVVGEQFAAAALALIAKANVPIKSIRAIGSHGQTIRHAPSGRHGYTVQIGDPNTIAELTGITTVADFRRRDIAAGGQGAPLVPAFHAPAFASPDHPRAIINIGGIANISVLRPGQEVIGFDTGSGNMLMDGWIYHHKKLPFDADGEWARQGTVQPQLLARLMMHPFLRQRGPKSTGREAFNLNWLQLQLAAEKTIFSPEDVQATLLEFTAQSIADQIPKDIHELYFCGGGIYNTALLQRLKTLLPSRKIEDTGALGIGPKWVEAAAFAWLAKRTIEGKPANASGVTGASGPRILGGIYQP